MEAKDKIKKHISEVGISQSKLAELSGLAFGTINRILNGKQELLPNTLAKIAEALNLSVSQLMQDETVEVMDAEGRDREIMMGEMASQTLKSPSEIIENIIIRCMSKNQLVFSGQNAPKSLTVNDVQNINSSPVFIP